MISIIPYIEYINTSVSGTNTNGTVIISLKNAATGQPVNGFNMVVSYNEVFDGIITAKTVTIPGQSVVIYNGLLKTDFQIVYSATLTAISNAPNPAPPVAQCDLEINFITVKKAESAPGANDAQIVVSATSSYLPIQYSLDNVTFQDSAVFTGLHGGAYTVYCTDANNIGCLQLATVTIPTTQGLLIADPSTTLTGGNISRWNAAFNPVVFTYQRKDFEVTAIAADNATGNAKVTVNGDMSALAAAISANQAVIANAAAQGITILNFTNYYIYLNAGPYAGVFTVNSADSSSVIINTPYTANATGFLNSNQLRPYYKVLTNITYIDPLTNTYNTITSVNRPNAEGITRADISNFLQSILRAKDASDYTQINFRDTNLSASYTIQYAEQYDDIASPGSTITSPYISIATPYYVTYTARQLQSKYGGNLAQYVPFPANQQAKWVTEFTEPVYTNAYPFDLSFIYGEALAGLQLYYKITLLDINRQPINTNAITSYLLNEDGSWLLNQDASKLVIAAQNLFNTPIVQYVGLNRLLINQNFQLNAYYFTIALFYNDEDNNPLQVTELLTVRIDHTPDINSVYMRWIGLTGSWNYYRFIFNQEISLDVQNATIIKNFITDWENQDGIEEVISKDAGQKVKLTAEDLSVADIKGLQSIKYSPKVQMMLSAGPVKWQTVALNTATFTEYDTFNGQAPFSITFNQPSINIQTQ
jgi:hypothetical protein